MNSKHLRQTQNNFVTVWSLEHKLEGKKELMDMLEGDKKYFPTANKT